MTVTESCSNSVLTLQCQEIGRKTDCKNVDAVEEIQIKGPN